MCVYVCFLFVCRFVLMIVSNKNNNNNTRHFQSLWFVFDDINLLFLFCVYAFLTNFTLFYYYDSYKFYFASCFVFFLCCFSAHFMNCYFFFASFLTFFNAQCLFSIYFLLFDSSSSVWSSSLLSFSRFLFFFFLFCQFKHGAKRTSFISRRNNKKANDYRNTVQFIFRSFLYISKRKRTHK